MSTTSYFSSAIGEHRFSFQQLLDSALDHELGYDMTRPALLLQAFHPPWGWRR
jgi:hypothetical protein